MSQMVQVAGVSPPVYNEQGEDAEVLDMLTVQQENAFLAMFAYAKHLAATVKGKDNVFLDALEQMSAPQHLLEKVRGLFKADSDQDRKQERLYANAMIVISDMLRRVVAAHNLGEKIDPTRALEMEQAAAVMTRPGTNKLQQVSAKPVTEFCRLFGLAKTGELQRLMMDPSVLEKDQRQELAKELKASFELKKAVNGVTQQVITGTSSGQPPVQEAQEEQEQQQEEKENGELEDTGGENGDCPAFGANCWHLLAGKPCTHQQRQQKTRQRDSGGRGGGRGRGRGRGGYNRGRGGYGRY